jgi:aspartate/methionine/tyrosine aminotransferase
LTELLVIVTLKFINTLTLSSGQQAVPSKQITSSAGTDSVLTFTLSGLSKVAGLPQMKLAWICVNGPTDLLNEAMSRLEVIADTYLSVNTPVQHGLPYLLGQRQHIQRQIRSRLLQNRQFLLDQLCLEETPCTLLDLEGGWYSILRVPQTYSDEEWALQLLDNDGVLVHPGYLFDFDSEGYLVISLLPPSEIFRQGIERLLRCIATLSSCDTSPP